MEVKTPDPKAPPEVTGKQIFGALSVALVIFLIPAVYAYIYTHRGGPPLVVAPVQSAPPPASDGAGVAAVSLPAKPAFQVTVPRADIMGCVQSGGACLKDARTVPYFVDGKILGWKLFQIRKGTLFEKLKFQDGDVLLSANGEGLTDVSRIPFWMMQIVTVKSVDLGILRDGRPMRIDYQMKD